MVGVTPLIDQLKETESNIPIDSCNAKTIALFLRERGGIYVLDDLEITTRPKPRQFLPKMNEQGEDNLGRKPHWSYGFTYLLTDPKFFLVDHSEELLRMSRFKAKPQNRLWRLGKIKALRKQNPAITQEIYCQTVGNDVIFAYTKEQVPLVDWCKKHGLNLSPG